MSLIDGGQVVHYCVETGYMLLSQHRGIWGSQFWTCSITEEDYCYSDRPAVVLIYFVPWQACLPDTQNLWINMIVQQSIRTIEHPPYLLRAQDLVLRVKALHATSTDGRSFQVNWHNQSSPLMFKAFESTSQLVLPSLTCLGT